MKVYNLPIAIAIVLLVFSAFSFAGCRGEDFSTNHIEITGEKGKKALKKCFKVQVMDKTIQIDGKVDVTYTNICDDYEFHLTKTGLKYSDYNGTKYLSRNTPMVVRDNRSLTLSIPLAIKPKLAYSFDDDVKVYRIK